MLTTEQRALIISQLRAGRSARELVPFFSEICSKATLYRVAREFANGAEEKPKKKQKHPWRKIDPKMAATIVRRLTTAKTHHSIRSVSRDFGLSHKAVQKLLRKKGQNCYRKRKRNLIPKTQEAQRKFCSMRFRKRFRKTDLRNFLFVDECYVTVQKSFNHQNERCYGKNFEFIPDWKKFKELPKTPLSAMVFGGVSREGRTPLVVLRSGFRLNQFTYKEQCIEFVQRNLPYNLNAKTAILYQDKAPCHAAGSVQRFLKVAFPSFVHNVDMPPNSPDLNVLDYCVWSILKERLNKYGLIGNFKKLKKLLKKEWNAIPQQAIQDAIDSWQSRVRAVEKVNGGHIEKN